MMQNFLVEIRTQRLVSEAGIARALSRAGFSCEDVRAVTNPVCLDEQRALSLALYESIIRDPKAEPAVKLAAQGSIDRLFGSYDQPPLWVAHVPRRLSLRSRRALLRRSRLCQLAIADYYLRELLVLRPDLRRVHPLMRKFLTYVADLRRRVRTGRPVRTDFDRWLDRLFQRVAYENAGGRPKA
ncbi:MAG: hypothetical protein ACM359_15595 [Bacillota bacterium]